MLELETDGDIGGTASPESADEKLNSNPNDDSIASGEHDDRESGDHPWAHVMPKDSVWSGWQGIAIMVIGVVLPSLIIISGLVAFYDRVVLLLWKQPIETLIELALLLAIPIGNLSIWNALCKNDWRHAIRRGVFNGISIGASAFIAIFTGAAATLRFPTYSESGVSHVLAFAIISALSMFSMSIGINLAAKVRETRISKSSKNRAVGYVAFGVLIALLGFVAAEAKSTCIRVAEYFATSDVFEERQKGLDFLKRFDPEKQIRMECSSRKAGGLPGLFIRIDNDTLRQLHFAITGKTFGEEQSQNFSNMTDEYLKNHVVGDRVPGLSLQKSAMYGQVNPTTVSSTVYWTFVFKNKNYEPQEARAEIGLPEGAVISGMTVWKDGRPLKTEFQPTGDKSNSRWSNIGHDAPGIVTDLGRGRMLLHCYPVPAQGFLRMSVAVTTPLKLHTISDASLALPRFMETNFDLNGTHSVRIVSDDEIGLSIKGVKADRASTGQHLIDGQLSSDALSGAGLSVSVKRPSVYGPIAIQDKCDEKNSYLVQTIRELPAVQPQHLVVVLDGSESLKPHIKELKRVLSALPSGMKASLVVASQFEEAKPIVETMQDGLANLEKKTFAGGQDNLEAVINATSVAGESKKGAVLWIHGPQPGYNKEIYITPPCMFMPSFYEISLNDGVMDAAEYFKNHREIGPFTEISRSASIASDLERFLTKWKPGGHDYVVEYQMLGSKHPTAKMATEDQCRETAALFSKERVSQLIRAGNHSAASEVAVYHRIVTPVSLASCLGSGESLESERLAYEHGTRNVRILDTTGNHINSSDTASSAPDAQAQLATPPSTFDSGDTFSSTAAPEEQISYMGKGGAPILQGATNGSIGPQGSNVVMGVNTAGTVRVNNLANLEAFLNIFANLVELLGLAVGGAFLISAFTPVKQGSSIFAWSKMSQPVRIAWGAVFVAAALMTPWFINYMVASARDANVFS